MAYNKCALCNKVDCTCYEEELDRCEHNCIKDKCVYNDCPDDLDYDAIILHMKKWQKKYNWKFKDSYTFWKMFWKELREQLNEYDEEDEEEESPMSKRVYHWCIGSLCKDKIHKYDNDVPHDDDCECVDCQDCCENASCQCQRCMEDSPVICKKHSSYNCCLDD